MYRGRLRKSRLAAATGSWWARTGDVVMGLLFLHTLYVLHKPFPHCLRVLIELLFLNSPHHLCPLFWLDLEPLHFHCTAGIPNRIRKSLTRPENKNKSPLADARPNETTNNPAIYNSLKISKQTGKNILKKKKKTQDSYQRIRTRSLGETVVLRDVRASRFSESSFAHLQLFLFSPAQLNAKSREDRERGATEITAAVTEYSRIRSRPGTHHFVQGKSRVGKRQLAFCQTCATPGYVSTPPINSPTVVVAAGAVNQKRGILTWGHPKRTVEARRQNHSDH